MHQATAVTFQAPPQIDLQTLSDGYDWRAYYCKGHVSIPHFIRTLRGEYLENAPPEEVEHTWARLTPVVGRAYDMLFTKVDGPAPGAFACTYYEPEV